MNSTLSGNRAEDRGGGIYNVGTQATVTNVTISNNAAEQGGGAIYNDFEATISLKNSIVAHSLGANGLPGENCIGSTVSLGHNFSSDGTCGFDAPGDLSGFEPKLGPLADNGGPTLTHALLEGSPAIDNGDNASCPATDQRGVNRPLDGNGNGSTVCDVGAYEFAPGQTPPPGSEEFIQPIYEGWSILLWRVHTCVETRQAMQTSSIPVCWAWSGYSMPPTKRGMPSTRMSRML
jgi:predicted outer membrane repeat protein